MDNETHIIEKHVRKFGRNIIAFEFKAYVCNLINLDYHIDEQMLALIRTAVEVADRLDADRSIPWRVKDTVLSRAMRGEVNYSNYVSGNDSGNDDFKPNDNAGPRVEDGSRDSPCTATD